MSSLVTLVNGIRKGVQKSTDMTSKVTGLINRATIQRCPNCENNLTESASDTHAPVIMDSKRFWNSYENRIFDTVISKLSSERESLNLTDIELDRNEYRAIDLDERLENLDLGDVDAEQLAEDVSEVATIVEDIDRADYRRHYKQALGDAAQGITIDDATGIVRCTECDAELDINLKTGEVTLSNAVGEETQSYTEYLRNKDIGTVIEESIAEEFHETTTQTQSREQNTTHTHRDRVIKERMYDKTDTMIENIRDRQSEVNTDYVEQLKEEPEMMARKIAELETQVQELQEGEQESRGY